MNAAPPKRPATHSGCRKPPASTSSPNSDPGPDPDPDPDPDPLTLTLTWHAYACWLPCAACEHTTEWWRVMCRMSLGRLRQVPCAFALQTIFFGQVPHASSCAGATLSTTY